MSLLGKVRYAGENAKMGETTGQMQAVSIRNPTLSETCDEKIKYHQEQIRIIEETKQLLERNPDFEKLLQNLNEVH